MRFKRLRLFVGIALVAFILLTANIIVFGFLNGNSKSAQQAILDNKKLVVSNYTVSTAENKTQSQVQPSQSSQPNQSNQNSQENTQPPAPIPPPVTTITHMRMNTRAS